jgi:uncharacterized membrane protein YkoI
MNSRTGFAIAVLTAALAASAIPGAAAAQPRAARITVEDARARALRAAPGAVLTEELEREHGRMIYSFEIRATGAPATEITEVNIDASDGRVVSIEHERASAPVGNRRNRARP